MKRIGDILTRHKTAVVVRDDTVYRQVTIRTNYKGVVLRGSQTGSTIGTKNQWRVSAGQFILSRIDARNGAFGIVPPELEGAIVTNDFLAFDINEAEVEREFFNVFLQSPEFLEACIKASRGNTNRKRVDEDFFLDHRLNLPPIHEQRSLIAKFARARVELDSARAEIDRQEMLLARLRQSILQEAVRGDLTAVWRAKNLDTEPAGKLLTRIAAEKARLIAAGKFRREKPIPKLAPTEIPFKIPVGWTWCRAANIGFVIGGLTKNAAKRGGHKRMLPYLRVANVYANRLDLSDLQELGVTDSEVEKLLLKKDDLLVVEGNGSRDQVGRIALWDGSVDPCVHQNHVIKVRIGDPKVAPWALYWFLSPSGRTLIEEQAKTSTGLYNLSTGKVANLLIPLPPLAEQHAIVERVETLNSVCQKLGSEISRSRERADALIAALLSELTTPRAEPRSNVITFSQSYDRALLAAEIIDRIGDEPTFGHVKHQKILFLAEHAAELDEIDSHCERAAAGPYDREMLREIDDKLRACEWFSPTQETGGRVSYQRLDRAGEHREVFEQRWPDKVKKLRDLIDGMKTWPTERCERLATVYGAWNDLLIAKRPVTNDAILAEILHHWHPSKTKIPESKWRDSIAWLREHGPVPTGFGRPTRVETTAQAELF